MITGSQAKMVTSVSVQWQSEILLVDICQVNDSWVDYWTIIEQKERRITSVFLLGVSTNKENILFYTVITWENTWQINGEEENALDAALVRKLLATE